MAQRAAVAYAAGRAALSSVTALDVHGVLQQLPGEPVHVDVPAETRLHAGPGLVVHRRQELILIPPRVVVRRTMPVIRLEDSLVDAWPVLPPDDRAGPVIRAVNDRLTTVGRLERALSGAPRLPGRAQLRGLLARLAAGCRSPLEIWGHDHVFVGPGMPAFARQVPIWLGSRTVYLDLYAERERVNIELDGAMAHGDPRQRERDLRRDAQLATLGILTVRFSGRRLIHEPGQVRRETLAILASRR
ncbi:endonuclease domain-containing protein [Plantactinospora siamensis]|uniref:Endonuclease domain-containing protein n=1 Tax=Plantactinospora siamensis TaxID=555372 RepID=A0ABV6P089_9ACTN